MKTLEFNGCYTKFNNNNNNYEDDLYTGEDYDDEVFATLNS